MVSNSIINDNKRVNVMENKIVRIKIEEITRTEYESLLGDERDYWRKHKRYIDYRDKPPKEDINDLCYTDYDVIISSFSSKCFDERNNDFFESQREENRELDFWLDCIDKIKERR